MASLHVRLLCRAMVEGECARHMSVVLSGVGCIAMRPSKAERCSRCSTCSDLQLRRFDPEYNADRRSSGYRDMSLHLEVGWTSVRRPDQVSWRAWRDRRSGHNAQAHLHPHARACITTHPRTHAPTPTHPHRHHHHTLPHTQSHNLTITPSHHHNHMCQPTLHVPIIRPPHLQACPDSLRSTLTRVARDDGVAEVQVRAVGALGAVPAACV
eukprot:544842-Rhodomonas_salina.3